jgi:DNA-binding SARP family transcriptional activator
MGINKYRISENGVDPLSRQQRMDTVTPLRIYGLGHLHVFYGQVLLRFPTKKSQDLLCFLLMHAGETLERDLIAEQLWPGRLPGKARRCLSTALWRLRKTLECMAPSAQSYLLIRSDTLAFNTTAPYWFDVEVFERQAAVGLAGPLPCDENHRKALEEALDLYCGDLFEGCYDDWCLADRERLQLLLLQVLKRLQRDFRIRGHFETAISLGLRLLKLDSMQEDVHRELMRCYIDAGQRPLALEQFRHCREILRRELEIEPMSETWRLYWRIRAVQESTLLRETWESRYDSLKTALAQLRVALDTLESIWQTLQVVSVELVQDCESAQDETIYPPPD